LKKNENKHINNLDKESLQTMYISACQIHELTDLSKIKRFYMKSAKKKKEVANHFNQLFQSSQNISKDTRLLIPNVPWGELLMLNDILSIECVDTKAEKLWDKAQNFIYDIIKNLLDADKELSFLF
jgi:uncharacterized protein with HEPN domain